MKLYLTAAGIYAGTQQEAKADGKGWRLEEVPTSKQELIGYLNALKHGEKTEQGLTMVEVLQDEERVALAEEYPPKPSYGQQSIALDDQFDKLPIARQLDFAARAMENARDALTPAPVPRRKLVELTT